MRNLGELRLKEAASEVAGDRVVVYLHASESLREMSNAFVIEDTLEEFTEGDDPDVVEVESKDCYRAYSLRIHRHGRITTAFKVFHRLARQVAQHPNSVLDENDYYARNILEQP